MIPSSSNPAPQPAGSAPLPTQNSHRFTNEGEHIRAVAMGTGIFSIPNESSREMLTKKKRKLPTEWAVAMGAGTFAILNEPSEKLSPTSKDLADAPPLSQKKQRLYKKIQAVAEGTGPFATPNLSSRRLALLPTASERAAIVRPPGAVGLPSFAEFCESTEEEAKKALNEAIVLRGIGKREEALPLIDKALKHPHYRKNIFALNLKIETLFLLFYSEECLKTIQQCLAFTNNDPSTPVPTSIEDTKVLVLETILSLEELSSLSPTIIQAKVSLVQMTIQVLMRLGELNTALEIADRFLNSELIKRGVAQDPTWMILICKMVILHRLKRSEECLATAEKALAGVNSDNIMLQRTVLSVHKAMSLQEMGYDEEALAIAEEILSRDPQQRPALICKTKCLFNQCRFNEALEIIERYLISKPKGAVVNNITMGYLKVDVLLEQGKVRDAIEAFLSAGKDYSNARKDSSTHLSQSEWLELKDQDFRIRLKLNAHCSLDPREFPK